MFQTALALAMLETLAQFPDFKQGVFIFSLLETVNLSGHNLIPYFSKLPPSYQKPQNKEIYYLKFKEYSVTPNSAQKYLLAVKNCLINCWYTQYIEALNTADHQATGTNQVLLHFISSFQPM